MSKKPILLILKEGAELDKGLAVSIVWDKTWQKKASQEIIGLMVQQMSDSLLKAIENKNVKEKTKTNRCDN